MGDALDSETAGAHWRLGRGRSARGGSVHQAMDGRKLRRPLRARYLPRARPSWLEAQALATRYAAEDGGGAQGGPRWLVSREQLERSKGCRTVIGNESERATKTGGSRRAAR